MNRPRVFTIRTADAKRNAPLPSRWKRRDALHVRLVQGPGGSDVSYPNKGGFVVLKGHLFSSPERVVFGRGVAGDVAEYVAQLGGKRPMIVTDPVVAKTSAFETIPNSLKKRNFPYVLYTECDVNPTDRQIDHGRDIYQAENCDVIIGVGGGSNLDSAKSIGIVASNPGSIRDYFVPSYVTDPYGIRNNVRNPPTIVIPTTAGTGAEVCGWTVVTNTAENYKGFCGGWTAMPSLALLDPDLTVSMPPLLTASTGFDALIHGIEAYYHRYAMPQTDLYALSAIRRIVEYLPRAVADGNDIEARGQMLLGAMEAGLAMNTGCALVHAMGLPLTTEFGLSHGVTLAITAGPVFRFNAATTPDKLNAIAAALGKPAAKDSQLGQAAADAVRGFARALGIPINLDAKAHDPSRIPAMAAAAEANDNTRGNPRKPTRAEIEALYREAYVPSA